MKALDADGVTCTWSSILSSAQAGERVLIRKDGQAVAVVLPFGDRLLKREREAAVRRALRLMKKGLPFGGRRFTRDEMHER